jgi:D-ribose pyranase
MKKQGILNRELSRAVAGMGHLDRIVIADAGLPIPDGPQRIDLAVKPNVPRFMEVLTAVLEELEVQEVVMAHEMEEKSPKLYRELMKLFKGIPVEKVIHNELKRRSGTARAVVRTGEFTPYANVILVAGVVF